MRDQLLGYLLGALEPAEQEEVEAKLEEDAQLRQELAELRCKLSWLNGEEGDYEPPAGLAARTCNYVAVRAAGLPKNAGLPTNAAPAKSAAGLAPHIAWRVQDLVVGSGVFLAACLLLVPAIAHSLSQARLTQCQNNLRVIGVALGQYSDYYGGYFPYVPERGPLAAAGVYGPLLSDLRLIDQPARLVCPASPLAAEGDAFTLPSLEQIAKTPAADLPRVQSRLGGSYGYGLGYSDRGRYRGHRNRGRATFAMMADSPGESTGGRSANHGEVGQNVLFEDLHVALLKHCRISGCDDHIYVNGHGYVGAGVGPDDAVIGRSSARPLSFQLVPAQ